MREDSRYASCHNLVAEDGNGPLLENVNGRRAGRAAGISGSAALTAPEVFWTRENLLNSSPIRHRLQRGQRWLM